MRMIGLRFCCLVQFLAIAAVPVTSVLAAETCPFISAQELGGTTAADAQHQEASVVALSGDYILQIGVYPIGRRADDADEGPAQAGPYRAALRRGLGGPGEPAGRGAPLFPGDEPGETLSTAAMAAVIDRMNEAREAAGRPRWIDPKLGRDAVLYGFRSTFKGWCTEQTGYPNEMSEMALAHRCRTRSSRPIAAATCWRSADG